MSWDLPGPPDIVNEDNIWTPWAYYNARSLLYWYRQWHQRTLTIVPLDSYIMQLVLAGRLDDPPSEIIPYRRDIPQVEPETKYDARWGDVTITDGEIDLVTDWLANHFDAGIYEQFTANQRWVIDVSGWGRFVPSGGQTPRLLLRNDS